jgi:hypothetical protein
VLRNRAPKPEALNYYGATTVRRGLAGRLVLRGALDLFERPNRSLHVEPSEALNQISGLTHRAAVSQGHRCPISLKQRN